MGSLITAFAGFMNVGIEGYSIASLSRDHRGTSRRFQESRRHV